MLSPLLYRKSSRFANDSMSLMTGCALQPNQSPLDGLPLGRGLVRDLVFFDRGQEMQLLLLDNLCRFATLIWLFAD